MTVAEKSRLEQIFQGDGEDDNADENADDRDSTLENDIDIDRGHELEQSESVDNLESEHSSESGKKDHSTSRKAAGGGATTVAAAAVIPENAFSIPDKDRERLAEIERFFLFLHKACPFSEKERKDLDHGECVEWTVMEILS
jgi:hypothetical protein